MVVHHNDTKHTFRCIDENESDDAGTVVKERSVTF